VWVLCFHGVDKYSDVGKKTNNVTSQQCLVQLDFISGRTRRIRKDYHCKVDCDSQNNKHNNTVNSETTRLNNIN